MTTTSWISRAVIYQVNPRSLAFREPRNAIEALQEQEPTVSPYAYITQHLDVLKTFGMTVLHFMPPFEMGVLHRKGIGSPYAARDFLSVDPEHGTMEEFKTMVRTAREKGFKVIMGMMPNHSSRDHVWIQSNPDYFVQNEAGDIIYDLDWSDTAKLNYKSPGLRKAMYEVYDFWLNILGDGDGVDGFRIDMAHFINDLSFWDDTIAPLREKYNDRELLFLAECYGIDNSMDLFRRGFNASYDDAFYKLLEHYYGITHENQTVLFSPGFHAENTAHSPQYEVFKQTGFAGAVKALLTEYEAKISELDHPVVLARYLDNHDEGRSMYRFGPGAVKAMAMLTYFSSHCAPFMLTGHEFGAVNRPSIHERFGLCDKGRNETNGETIVRKEGVEFEGNSFLRGFASRRDFVSFYKELIRFRADHPCLQTGALTWLDLGEEGPATDHTLVAFERSQDGETLRCAINLGHHPRSFSVKEVLSGEVIYGGLANPGQLAPFSSVVVKV